MATLAGWGGAPWRSWAAFETDAAGEVTLSTAPALGGTYRGNASMGLFWSMQRQEDELGRVIPLTGAFPLTLAAGGHDGSRAEVTLHRRLVSEGVTSRAVARWVWSARSSRRLRPGRIPRSSCSPARPAASGSPRRRCSPHVAMRRWRWGTFTCRACRGVSSTSRSSTSRRRSSGSARPVKPRESFVAVVGVARGGELALLLGASIREIGAVVAYVPSGVVLGALRAR